MSWMPDKSFRGVVAILAGLLPGLAGGACSDALGGGDGGGAVAVVARPAFPAALAAGQYALDIDRVDVLLLREPSELLLDTSVVFPAESTQIAVRLRVLLAQPRDRLKLVLELRSGKRLLFSGSQSFDAVGGESLAPIVPLQYVGPGATLTSLLIEPRDTALRPGDSLRFGIRAFQERQPVDSFYVGWASSDPKVASVTAQGVVRAPPERGAVTLRVVSPTGVKDSTRVWFAPRPTAITRVSGDGQEGVVGEPLPVPLRVQVTAADGLGAPGARVRFVSPFGSSVRDTLVITDEAGFASTIATLGTVPTLYTFEARLGSFPPVFFQAIGRPGPAQTLAKEAGDGQSATAGQTLNPLVVRAMDKLGNGVGGVSIAWEILSGQGTLSSSSSLTDATGRAAVTYRLGPLPGTNLVGARLPSGATAVFTATGTP